MVSVVTTFLDALAAGDSRSALDLLDVDIEWRNTGLPTLRGRRATGALIGMEKRGVGFGYTMHAAAAEGEGAEGGNATHHEVNLFGSKIKVPKEPKIAPPADKKKYTPPPIPDVCDGEHCAGCLTQQECTVAMEHSEHGLGEHCMWNKKKQVC